MRLQDLILGQAASSACGGALRQAQDGRGVEDDQRVINPDLVQFVNDIPLVVIEAKSPSLKGSENE